MNIRSFFKRIFFNKKLQILKFYFFIAVISFTFSFLGYKLSAKPQIIPNIIRMLFRQPKSASQNDVLFKRIVTEVPELTNKNAVTQFEIVSAIRNWTYQNIPLALDKNLTVSSITGKSSALTTLSERFKLFDSGIAGAWCGTTATTLMDIYEMFGYEAYAIDTGDFLHAGSNNTHVMTLVRINYNNQDILNLQDAYFNYSLGDLKGEPLDYFTLLNLLSQGKTDQIKIISGKNEIKPQITASTIPDKKIDKLFPSGNKIYYAEHTLNSEKNSLFSEKINEFLKEYEYPPNFLYINLFPFDVFSRNEDLSQPLLRRIKTITGYWCYKNENCWIE